MNKRIGLPRSPDGVELASRSGVSAGGPARGPGDRADPIGGRGRAAADRPQHDLFSVGGLSPAGAAAERGRPAERAARATPEQAKSLRKLEGQAIDRVIKLHGLSEGDRSAVQTWGREQVLATLYSLLLNAIDADDRTEDQENAVDWLTAMAQRKAVLAAEAAGHEYVEWAGIDKGAYDSLLQSNPNETQLEEFLDDSPQTWGPPSGRAAATAPIDRPHRSGRITRATTIRRASPRAPRSSASRRRRASTSS